MKIRLLISFFAALVLVSCSQKATKKVVLVTKGDINFDSKNNAFEVSDGSSYADTTIPFSSKNAIEIGFHVQATGKKFPVDQNGVYLINGTSDDTLIGVRQHYTEHPALFYDTIKLVMIQHTVDSLKGLIGGVPNKDGSSFFLLPFTCQKITTNLDAQIVAPYHQMLTLDKVDNKTPEVYCFYSVKEVRENMNRLEQMLKVPAKKNKKSAKK